MTELLRTNDLVFLSWAQALLRDAGYETVLMDAHTSLIEGSIGAIPRRLMIDEASANAAKSVLEEAGAVER